MEKIKKNFGIYKITACNANKCSIRARAFSSGSRLYLF